MITRMCQRQDFFKPNEATEFEHNLAVAIIRKAIEDYRAGPETIDRRMKPTRRMAFKSAEAFLFGADPETVTYREWLLSLTTFGTNLFAMVRRSAAA